MTKTKGMKKITSPESELINLVSTDISNHALTRMRERRIDIKAVQMAILYGYAILKQGVTFYVMRKRDIPRYVKRDEVRKMKDLVVVWSNEENAVITCYRRADGMKYVKRKTDRYIARLDGRNNYAA